VRRSVTRTSQKRDKVKHNLPLACIRSRHIACNYLKTITPLLFGVVMFGSKQQQQQEESFLCKVLVVFNLALLSAFIFFCINP
jgi:hypothetical protein